MKLKNKKTGEIVELKLVQVNDKYLEDHEVDLLNGEKLTLKSLADSFDDVKEPLIKDEKIRKAVRAWAEANNFLDEIEVHSLTAGTRFSIGHYDIEFLGYFIYDLESNKTYTITELCGELQDDANMSL